MPTDPTVAKVVSLSEMRSRECARLRLSVNKKTLTWEYQASSNSIPYGQPVDLTFSDADQQLIEMFSDVQQLLIELRPDEAMQRDAVNSKLFVVAAELGDRLYRVLFQDPDLVKYLNIGLNAGIAGTHFFRIELEFLGNSAYMAAWPWEYLHRPGTPGKPESGKFLALSSNLIMNRYLRTELAEKFSTHKPTLLLVVARPHDLGPVACKSVISVTEQLKDEKVVALHTLIEPPSDGLQEHFQPVASWAAFQEHVRAHKPQIIHFIGHGQLISRGKKNVGQLAFVADGGEAQWIDEEDFAQTVDHPGLRLVFLQACESGRSDLRDENSGIANSLISKKVPAVVAMQAKVHNLVADTFAHTVYTHLKAGLPVDLAVMHGREAIKNLQNLGASEKKFFFGVPIVYLGSHQGLIDTTEPEPKQESQPLGGASRSTVTPADVSELACPHCRKSVKPQMTFCRVCGLQLLCTNPERVNNPCERLAEPTFDASFCSDCGFPLLARPRPPERAVDPARDGTYSEPSLLRDKTKEAPTPGGRRPLPPPKDTGG